MADFSRIYPDFKPLNQPGQPLRDAMKKRRPDPMREPLYQVHVERMDGRTQPVTPKLVQSVCERILEAVNRGIITGANTKLFSNPHLVRVRN